MCSDHAHELYDPLFGDATVSGHMTSAAWLQAMLDVEVSLTAAEADIGLVPASCVEPIREAAQAHRYDPATIAAEAADDGNLAIPLVRHLTRQVAAIDADAARYVHWGATSQDILDTALVLQLTAAVPPIVATLDRAAEAAAGHARRYALAVMPGRTWLQQATPITFGLKAAGWLEALDRQRRALAAALEHARVLQFGGASGTLAALGDAGPRVAERLAARLGLRAPDMPWHAHRDRLVQLACALGVACGTCGKIARDLSLLAQTEVGEAFEAREHGGGSSTMPHKRNPVSASVALAAAVRAPGLVATMLAAMPQEHERGLGGWQAEWTTLPELVVVAAGAARTTADALEHLIVDTDRMRRNVNITRGLVLAEAVTMALAVHIGRQEAHRRVEAATRQAASAGITLAEALQADSLVTQHLTPARIADCLSPESYLGAARAFIERVLAGTSEGRLHARR